MLLVAPDAHVGGRLVGSALIVGPLWFGALVCVCMVRRFPLPKLLTYPSWRHGCQEDLNDKE